MGSFADLINPENKVFSSYAFWVSILVIKMLVMSPLTGMQRFKKKAFANKEDLKSDKQKVVFNDEDVERVRRAHRNDLENVLPFIAIGFFYVLTNPAAGLAILLFRVAAISRIAHTLVYAVWVIPQPARGLAWMGCFAVTFYMAISCSFYFI